MTCSGKSAGCILIVCGKEGGKGEGGRKRNQWDPTPVETAL